MASRIPQPRPAVKEKPFIAKPMDLEAVHSSLIRLGGPTLSLDQLGRLYQGPLQEVLSCVVDGIRGRNGSAAARSQLQSLRANESSRRKMANSEVEILSRNETKARARLESAKTNLHGVRKQLDEKLASLAASEAEIKQLQAALDEKRRTNLLLAVLEAKEKIRASRFEEMTKLLDALRTKIANSEAKNDIPTLHDMDTTRVVSVSVTHTRDTLTNLHAHHIYLTQLASQATDEDALESRLRQSIANAIGLEETDEQVSSRMNLLILSAREQAKRKVQYPIMITGQDHDLAALANIRDVKQQELQELSDRSIALGYLSKQYIDHISEFIGTTSQKLRTSLEDEAPQTKAYVDVLKWLITNSPSLEPSVRDTDIREACGIKANMEDSRVVLEMQKLINTVHQQEVFLASAVLKKSAEADLDAHAHICDYDVEQKQHHDKAFNLLSRKVAKIDNTLVSDIETIIREADMIANINL